MPLTDKAPPATRKTIYYGWRIVGLGYVLNLMTAAISSSSFSVFVKPMGDDLGWSRSSIIAATSVGMISTALFGHFLGKALDKTNGARIIAVGGMLTIGTCAILAGRVQEIWQLLALFFIGGAVGMYAYPALITPTIVSKWFVRKRGMAISFASMGLSSSGVLLSPYSNFLISQVGWRNAWAILGGTAWIFTVPWCFLYMRRRPEDIGLRPDGDLQVKGNETCEQGSPNTDEYSWTVAEAIKTRAFWLILISSSLGMMCFMGVLINFFAFATDANVGFSNGQATIGFATFSSFSLTGKLPWAYLSDKIDIRYSTAFTYTVPAIGIAILIYANSFWMLVLWGVIFGIGISGISPLPALSWGDYYGRTLLGSIRGITSPIAYVTQAASPLFAAFVYDLTGGYTVPFSVFLGIFLVCAVLMLFARRPIPPESKASSSLEKPTTFHKNNHPTSMDSKI